MSRVDWVVLRLTCWSSFCVTTWHIWKARCYKVFENKILSVAIVAKQIDYAVDRHLGKQQHHRSASFNVVNQELKPTIWIPPDHGIVKINVDVSFLSAEAPIGIGFLFRNSIGKFISAATESGFAGSAEGECRALLQAAKARIRQGLKKVVIETDNQAVADFFTGKTVNLSWTSSNILE